jgi:hypothetical protein
MFEASLIDITQILLLATISVLLIFLIMEVQKNDGSLLQIPLFFFFALFIAIVCVAVTVGVTIGLHWLLGFAGINLFGG